MAVGLLGLALLAALLVVGVVVGTAMLALGLVRRVLARRQAQPAHRGTVVEAEYRVIDRPAHTLPY